MHYAAKIPNNYLVLQYLLDSGADVYACDNVRLLSFNYESNITNDYHSFFSLFL